MKTFIFIFFMAPLTWAQFEWPLAPETLTDKAQKPYVGTYKGVIKKLDLPPLRSQLTGLLTRKRWHYVAVATPNHTLILAVIDTGYAIKTFLTLHDLAQGKIIHNFSSTAPILPLVTASSVNGFPNEGAHVEGYMKGVQFILDRPQGSSVYSIEIKSSQLEGNISFDAANANANALSVIGQDPKGRHQYTQKLMGLSLSKNSWLKSNGAVVDLSKGVAGIDYTDSHLPHETKWKWLFVQGFLPDGTPVSTNLTHFKGDDAQVSENALWVGDRLLKIPRVNFEINSTANSGAIKALDGALNLKFSSVAGLKHSEKISLPFIQSEYLYFTGKVSGEFTFADQTSIKMNDLPAILEDQNIIW